MKYGQKCPCSDHSVPLLDVVDNFPLNRVQFHAGPVDQLCVQADPACHRQQQQQLVVAVRSWAQAHTVRQVLQARTERNRGWVVKSCSLSVSWTGKSTVLISHLCSPSRYCCSCVQGKRSVPCYWRDSRLWYRRHPYTNIRKTSNNPHCTNFF